MPTLLYQKPVLQLAAVALLCMLIPLTTGCLHQPQTRAAHDNANADILLLTTNDLHGRLEPFTIQENQGPRPAGGFAELTAQMNRVTGQQQDAMLRLNSGDTLTGPYAAHFNGKALFGGLSRMGIDVATLGNHEFDRGPKTLAQALTHCLFPIVVTNIDLPAGHVLAETIQPYALFERAGKLLLVVGLLTADLSDISSPGSEITILDPGSEDVRSRIQDIINQHNPDLVIALTHLGLEQDRRIAVRIPEINVICGGHSHDLLQPGRHITIEHAEGRQTVIVQAGFGGIALGVLRVRLQPGTQPAYIWLPQKINASSGQCPQMLAFIENYRCGLPPTRIVTSAETAIDCRSAVLRSREAPIGNFIADSLRVHFNTDVALYNGGGVRGDYMLPAGPISSMDVETMLPFGNKAVVVRMSGEKIRQVLKRSVAQLPLPWGGFLQVSGLRMHVDLQISAPQQRITSVDILGADGKYLPLAPERFYRVVTNSFLARGGNGYSQFRDAQAEPPSRMLIRTIIMHQLASQPHHTLKTDDRITIQTCPNKH